MGSVFPLIADEALVPLDADDYTACQVCNQARPVYVTYGRPITAAGKRREEVYAACAECFRDGKLEQVTPKSPLVQSVQDYLQAHFKGKSTKWRLTKQKQMIEMLDRTPCCLPPFRQDLDWPLCCGELTEYLGSPSERAELLSLAGLKPWNYGVDERGAEEGVDFAGCPEELLVDVAIFQCQACSQSYVVFQPT